MFKLCVSVALWCMHMIGGSIFSNVQNSAQVYQYI